MATLYVTEPDTRIEKEYLRIIVTREGEVIQSAPISSLTEIVIVGFASATTQALLTLLDAGIGITFLTRAGKMRGRLVPAVWSNLPLRLSQYAQQNAASFQIDLVRQLIHGKLCNYSVLARRIMRRLSQRDSSGIPSKPSSPPEKLSPLVLKASLESLVKAIAGLKTANDLDTLRGLEGIGSKAYFSILRAGLSWKHEFGFLKRQRRPPKDPINALLSFGYALLTNAMVSALTVAGLDPEAGYLHANQRGRPSLALDLIEEFRPIIVDSMVLRLVNQQIITLKSFEEGNEGEMLLTKKGLTAFFTQYHQRINCSVMHPFFGKKLTYQKCFEAQAVLLKKVILGEEQRYIPMTWR